MEFEKVSSLALKEEYFCGTHKSGLRVFVMPKKGYSKSYAVFGTHFGSVDSKFIAPGENEPTVLPDGVAHFLEHKMFEKEDYDVFEKFSAHSASSNAFTSFTRTCYLFSCTSDLKENLTTREFKILWLIGQKLD